MVTSKQFYTKLTPAGLAKRKGEDHTKNELEYLKTLLPKHSHILDLGCGYGRLTIPLAEEGYSIAGIDITPSFIKKAKSESRTRGLSIDFQIGDMKNLPYAANQFHCILCMWSVFMELTKESDQLKALAEMKRVLIPGGLALLEFPKPYLLGSVIKDETNDDEIKIGKNSIILGKLSGIKHMPSFRHDESSLKNLMKKAKIKKFDIFIDKFGGKDRLFLKFWK